MVKIPKYVEKLLEKRRKLADNLFSVCCEIENYCDGIGLNPCSPLFADACLCTDILIYTEADIAIGLTREAILKQFELNKKITN